MIRYKPKDYARALIQSLKASPHKEKEVLRNFARILASRRDFSKWRQIMEIFEKLYIREFGENFIDVYVAREDIGYRNRVLQSIPKSAEITFHIDPSLIGGMRILINKEILIDGSVQRRIVRLFSR